MEYDLHPYCQALCVHLVSIRLIWKNVIPVDYGILMNIELLVVLLLTMLLSII